MDSETDHKAAPFTARQEAAAQLLRLIHDEGEELSGTTYDAIEREFGQIW